MSAPSMHAVWWWWWLIAVWQCAQVVRVVHPDKVPSSATPEERLAAQRVFAVLAATYESFKQQS